MTWSGSASCMPTIAGCSDSSRRFMRTRRRSQRSGLRGKTLVIRRRMLYVMIWMSGGATGPMSGVSVTKPAYGRMLIRHWHLVADTAGQVPRELICGVVDIFERSWIHRPTRSTDVKVERRLEALYWQKHQSHRGKRARVAHALRVVGGLNIS